MHNTISFYYGNWEKVCMKSSWRREDPKKGGPALHTDRNFIRNWFPVCKMDYSRKKVRVEDIPFWKKKKRISWFVISPLEILDKSYSSLKNPTKLSDTCWEWSQVLCFFSLLPLKVLVYFLFNPRKFHIVIPNYIPCKIQVLE